MQNMVPHGTIGFHFLHWDVFERDSCLFLKLRKTSQICACQHAFSPDSEAMRVLTSSIGGIAGQHFAAGMLVSLQGAAAGCRCCLRALRECAEAVRIVSALWNLLECCVRFAAGMLVSLQGVA